MNFKIDNNPLNISEFDNKLIINTRMKFSLKEIVIYSIPTFIFLAVGEIILSVVIGVFTLLIYSIYRVYAWFYYSEIEIDYESKSLYIRNFFNKKLIKKECISDKIKFENFYFKEIKRSGEVKFVMIYKTFKNNELLIINKEIDFFKIKRIFDQYKK